MESTVEGQRAASALAQACLVTVPARPPRTRLDYTNVGSGLLAVVVERLTGLRFGEAVDRLVLRPLAIEGYLGREPPRDVSWIAGDLGEHTGTALDPYNSAFWRSLALPWGGLVTTAAGALALVRAFAGVPAGFLSPELLAEATRDQTGGLSGRMIFLEWPTCPWGLGVELRGDKAPHWTPAEAAPTSFGHVGASGSLAWCDPAADVAWSMLGPASSSTGGRTGPRSAPASWRRLAEAPVAAMASEQSSPQTRDRGVRPRARNRPGNPTSPRAGGATHAEEVR